VAEAEGAEYPKGSICKSLPSLDFTYFQIYNKKTKNIDFKYAS